MSLLLMSTAEPDFPEGLKYYRYPKQDREQNKQEMGQTEGTE